MFAATNIRYGVAPTNANSTLVGVPSGTNKSTTNVDFTTNINLSMMVDGSQLKQLLQVLNPPLVGVPSGTYKSTTDADFITNIYLSMMFDCSQLLTSVTEQLLQMLNPALVGVPSGTNKSTTDVDFKTNVYLSKMLDCSQLTTPLGQHRWGHSVGATPLWQVIDKNSSTINKNFVGR